MGAPEEKLDELRKALNYRWFSRALQIAPESGAAAGCGSAAGRDARILAGSRGHPRKGRHRMFCHPISCKELPDESRPRQRPYPD
jgi:hypothetical protein